MKHTPGPWYAVPDDGLRHFVVNINPAGGHCITTIRTERRYAEQAMADGWLIAAAPELLEVARWLILCDAEGLLVNNTTATYALRAARAAIAKATGG